MAALGRKRTIGTLESGIAVHRDTGADLFKPVSPDEGCELRSLIGIHDLGRAELEFDLVQRFDPEVGFQRVGYPLGQYLPGVPVHDGNQIKEAAAHGM